MMVRQSAAKRKRKGHGRTRAAASDRGSHIPEIGLGRLLRGADMSFNRALRDELAKKKVTFSQFQHLWQLWTEDKLAQFELSRRIGIENSSSTAVIEQLEQRGLIHRRRDSQDRRRVIVTLTTAGKNLETVLSECAIVVNQRARTNISKSELSNLFDILTRVTSNLRS